MDYQSILNEIESWPVDERIRLLRDVCDRLPDHDQELELTEAMKAELDRRIDQMDRHPESGVPWEGVKANLLSRISVKKDLPQGMDK